MKITFGLSEILGIFGCYALVQSQIVLGSILVTLGIIGSFSRLAVDLHNRKENEKKLEHSLKALKDVFFTSKTPWDNLTDKNVH